MARSHATELAAASASACVSALERIGIPPTTLRVGRFRITVFALQHLERKAATYFSLPCNARSMRRHAGPFIMGGYGAAAQLVSVEGYLHTSYRPDCDYLEGVVVERNLGQFEHANLQTILAVVFGLNREKWGVLGLTELRLRVRAARYRVPDLLVLPLDYDRSPVVTEAPLLCIEIVSPDDRMRDLTSRARDYLALGVPETWIFDPETKQAFIYSADGLHEAPPNEVLRCGKIELNLPDLFAR